jgi:hypothetical protein
MLMATGHAEASRIRIRALDLNQKILISVNRANSGFEAGFV